MKNLFLSTLLLVGFALSGCGKKETQSKMVATNESFSSGNPLTAPADYLGAIGKAKSLSEKTLDTLTLNQAVQAFYAGEGRYPTDLNELVSEKYMPRLPEPPYGMKLFYDPSTGKVKLVAK
jgi:hypothetical protein